MRQARRAVAMCRNAATARRLYRAKIGLQPLTVVGEESALDQSHAHVSPGISGVSYFLRRL